MQYCSSVYLCVCSVSQVVSIHCMRTFIFFRRLKHLEFHGEFRNSFHYNNLLYGLLTRIAEMIGEDTWENLVRDNLYGPLGMVSSDFATTADPSSMDLASGYYNYYGEPIPVPFELSR